MSFVIKIVGLGSNIEYPAREPAEYVKAYDPEAMDGYGQFEPTTDPDEAMQFVTVKAAMECWQAIPRTRPFRPDGRPNKPLTALTVEVLSLEDAKAST